ncbi:F-box/LRR-repeat protein At5g63520 isoform X2 [Rhodamnia argentea]|uniref:F-box/LRR-repeat protein At5g63520 isoform X2 n=1 Tax=Rhodamnia argentea TaxID=178133 RepID=A0ABM3HJJ3_9MYRT|nr:F-box/LRR-repeat protein At5g63520 isoform X2 [Rhodamnia argentea]
MGSGRDRSGMASMSEDLMANIVGRLPAVSFAAAACVCKSWRRVCSQVLSRPKLASALSLNPSAHIALQEVVDKVLSEPIFPHFAIVHAGQGFSLAGALQYIGRKLGAQTPVIVSRDAGVIGIDVTTNEVKEVEWEDDSEDNVTEINRKHGIVLTVGFVPGLKVDCIPLVRLAEGPAMVDKFIMDIREYSTSISGCASPVGLILFGDGSADIKCVVEKLDSAMPVETAIVGDERGEFLYRSVNDWGNVHGSQECCTDAVALIFAKESIGEIRFHMALSDGVSKIGPRYKAVSVRTRDNHTWLTARREGREEVLDGESILNQIYDEMDDRIEYPELYIRVSKRRKHTTGAEKTKLITSLSFHALLRGDEEYLYLDGTSIKTGDYFQFYYTDPATALASGNKVSASLRSLNLGCNFKSSYQARAAAGNADKAEVLGGFMFACCGRGASFFGRPNVDCSPFVENFPGAPLAGMFCGGEIGCCSMSSEEQGSRRESSTRGCCHVYSTVYLVMWHAPAPAPAGTTLRG